LFCLALNIKLLFIITQRYIFVSRDMKNTCALNKWGKYIRCTHNSWTLACRSYCRPVIWLKPGFSKERKLDLSCCCFNQIHVVFQENKNKTNKNTSSPVFKIVLCDVNTSLVRIFFFVKIRNAYSINIISGIILTLSIQ
jgi:hypothetical protein